VAPRLRPEEMNDDIAGIDHHPIAGFLAFRWESAIAFGAELLRDMVGEGTDMSLGEAGCNNHVVGEAAFSGEVYGNDVLCFIIIEGSLDEAFQFMHLLGALFVDYGFSSFLQVFKACSLHCHYAPIGRHFQEFSGLDRRFCDIPHADFMGLLSGME